MTSKEFVLDTLQRAGLHEAQTIRAQAVSGELDGTAVIANAGYIPDYPEDGKRDFTEVPVGSPYRYDGQVYKLWQQHNANGQPDWTPDKAVSLWDICNTTDPAYAKPYVTPQGTRGIYQQGDCMIWTDGQVWRSTISNNAWTPDTYPAGWETVTV